MASAKVKEKKVSMMKVDELRTAYSTFPKGRQKVLNELRKRGLSLTEEEPTNS